jgi:hypothetical protein
MNRDMFEERERGAEAAYFREQDARLIQKLRETAKLEETATALAEKLQVDSPELLRQLRELGATRDTGSAFLLAPLVQVAWAEGTVSERERQAVLRLAADRGIESGSAAHAQLLEWLRERPSDAVFDAALAVIKVGLSVLSPAEREERVRRIIRACHEIAEASGGGLARVLGLASGVQGEEESILDSINAALRDRK